MASRSRFTKYVYVSVTKAPLGNNAGNDNLRFDALQRHELGQKAVLMVGAHYGAEIRVKYLMDSSKDP